MTLEELEKMSVVELKALKSDVQDQLSGAQVNLQVLNQLIQKKLANPEAPKPNG